MALVRHILSRKASFEEGQLYHEMKVLSDVLGYAGTYDQVNLGSSISLEVAARRIQALAEAYDGGIESPHWEVAKHIGDDDAQDVLAPEQRLEANRKARERMELERFRMRARATVEDIGAGGDVLAAVEAGGLANPDQAPRGRGRGTRGRGKGSRGAGR